MPDLIKREQPLPVAQDYKLPAPSPDLMESPEQGDFALLLLHLRNFFFRVVLKHKWLILAITISTLFLGILQTFTTTPTYRASLQLEVNPSASNVLPYQDISDSQYAASPEYLESQIKSLRSRLLAQRVIENLNLDEDPVFNAPVHPGILVQSQYRLISWVLDIPRLFLPNPQQTSPAPSSPSDQAEARNRRIESLIPRYLRHLDAQPIRNSRLIEVSYTCIHAPSAVRFLDAAVQQFIELNFESKFKTANAASEFLQKQVREQQIKVEKSEETLIQYARRHNILDFDQHENITLQRLSDLNSQITGGESRLSAARAGYDALRNASVDNFPQNLKTSSILDLERRISALQQQLANLSTTYGPNWPRVVETRQEIDSLTAQLRSEKERALAEAKTSFQTTLDERRNMLSTLEQQKRLAETLNENLVQYKILKREVDSNRQLYESLLQRTKEAGVSATLKPDNIRIIDRSGIPSVVHSPSIPFNLVASLFGGLFLALTIAASLTALDNTVKTSEDIERILGLVPLGVVPSIRTIKTVSSHTRQILKPDNADSLPAPDDPAIIPYDNVLSRSWEPYRALRTALLLSHPDSPPRAILITSALPSEGKTITSINIAITLAQTGARTLLIDLDMRRPRLAAIFGTSADLGMSAYLSGNIDKVAGIAQTAVPNLSLVPSGKLPPNPAELIGSRRMREALMGLRGEFDYVILDTPPILACTDAVILAPQVDGILLVTRVGKAPRKAVRSAVDQVLNVGGKVLGVVLNDLDIARPENAYYYGHSYQHYQEYHSGQ